MKRISVATTERKQIIDITDIVQKEVGKAGTGGSACCVFILHTTAAITTADLDPGTDQDILDAFESIVPKLEYRHPHNPSHVGDHIMSSIIGPDVTVLIENGKLVLGHWQRIVLVELDGPREREISITILK